MFPCCGGNRDMDPDIENSLFIDSLLHKERKVYRTMHRLLLLGAAESGKSTIVKQMQIINMDGFQDMERREFIPKVFNNVRDAVVTMLQAMHSLEITFDTEELVETATRIMDRYSTPVSGEYNEGFFQDCQVLWQSKALTDCYERSHEYHLIDSAKYFLDRLPDLRKPDYIPDDQDILRCRVMTEQITEIKFKVKEANFHMFDVGGQRDQRRKWIQCFNDATAVVFVTSLSGYNLTLKEDPSRNRLKESLDLFTQIWENRFLNEVSVILFLNKVDLLQEKIEANKHKLEDYFPSFKYYQPNIMPSKKTYSLQVPHDVTRAKLFIRDMFMSIPQTRPIATENGTRLCFPHFTCAVDTNHMRKIFEDCRIMIQRIHLERFGILRCE
ncbi:guanine nucleotide-binding protein G(s) subunit alpha-like [Clytia hemisphaerica]|uniref:Guanine nucleotide-binding protein G(s) subunit alpha n=1 Tax=Clytia hemisphaerica TaxID=252671 RepID=A0A7M5USD3_9CNID|eukprot:TCONS_00065469-protein